LDGFDKVQKFSSGYRKRTIARYSEVLPQCYGNKREQIISISDTHIPFAREDLIKDIVKTHSGAEWIVVNGDLFDSYAISTFPKEKHIPFAVEYAAAFELIRELAKNFGKVMLIDGNHDKGRFTREMGKLCDDVKFLVKGSPMEFLAEGRQFSPQGEDLGYMNLPNVYYAGDYGPSWHYKIGSAIFAHRLRGFKRGILANASHIADWMINRGTEFQCLVSAHSHRVGMAPYKQGKILIDQGCLCYPMDYEKDGACNGVPTELGYAIVELDSKGNVSMAGTRPIYLGTYQERH
jgi:predicted phosphodiesterase